MTMISPHLLSRLKWEDQELIEAQRRLPIRILTRAGNTYIISCQIPSIRYADPKLVRLYLNGGVLGLMRIATHEIQDDDLALISTEPVIMKVVLQLSETKGVGIPLVEIISPLCHPHILRRMCLGESWSPERSFASMLPGIIDCLLFKPGTYRLLDALNPSAAQYFQRQSRFKLPLEV